MTTKTLLMTALMSSSFILSPVVRADDAAKKSVSTGDTVTTVTKVEKKETSDKKGDADCECKECKKKGKKGSCKTCKHCKMHEHKGEKDAHAAEE